MTETKKRRALLAGYSAVQAFYWLGYCCIGSFAAVYLQNRLYSNAALGLIVALGNVGGFLLAPVLAARIDRSEKITVRHCLYALLLLEAILELLLIGLPGKTLAVSVVFILLMTGAVAVSPLDTELCFEMDPDGRYINFGISRSFGSVGYALGMFLLGRLVVRYSPELLPRASLAMIAVQGVVLAFVSRRAGASGERRETEKEKSLSLPAFLRAHKRFVLFCFGTGLLIFSNSLPSCFLINVVENLGGDASHMGTLACITALMEVPVMCFYTRLTRNIRCSTAVRIAACAFILKGFTYVIARSIPALYVMSITQMLSYGLLVPALVDYVGIVIPYRDSAKGQTISSTMMTLGTVFANRLGGVLLDRMSVTRTLCVGMAVCAVGTILCFLTVDAKRA